MINQRTALYRLLYGDDEGTVRLAKGTVSYSYEVDRFQVRDNGGKKVYGTDGGWDVERWLTVEGWM